MAIKFEDIRAGMTLYDRHTERAGNTPMRRLGEWSVKIIEVLPEKHSAKVSWNYNAAQVWHASRLRKLYTWSMYDDCAEVTHSAMLGLVISVKLKKGCKAPKPADLMAELARREATPSRESDSTG